MNSLRKCDASFYGQDPDTMNFLHFISQQFFRTPKLRALQIRQNHPYFDQGLDLDRTWFIESQIFASNICAGLLIERAKYKFKFLKNLTGTDFITGDQPVSSLGPDGMGFRFFYPLSPSLALLFEKDIGADLYSERNVGKLEVEAYNNVIFKNSYNQLYGSNKEYLKDVVSLPKDVMTGI